MLTISVNRCKHYGQHSNKPINKLAIIAGNPENLCTMKLTLKEIMHEQEKKHLNVTQ